MKFILQYSRFVPYLYFLAVISYCFTVINKTEGISAFIILLFSIPFIWQLLRPNGELNFVLGISFVCLSSYLILLYLSDLFNITNFFGLYEDRRITGGILLIFNFFMALWIIRNSLRSSP
jgi:hypothetical protein